MSDIKQVKIDNWGIFFLKRLQQFFNRTDFCDLTLQFENNVQLKVHRLVMNACTEYFQLLENTCGMVDDCLVMPLDLQPDIVVPIVNFMYTGQLEFQMSSFDKLYSAAKLMNLTILTKLLDAQKVPASPLIRPMNKRAPVTPVTWSLHGKKIFPKTIDPDLPEPLPGRKLPVWKRKSPNYTPSEFRPQSNFRKETLVNYKSTPIKTMDNTPRPTRFELPDEDVLTDPISVSSFDDISYGSQPLSTPISITSPISSSTLAFEEIKRSVSSQSIKRHTNIRSPEMNLQDMKEYIHEQKRRNDYIMKTSETQDDYDEIETEERNHSNKSILKPSSNDEEHPPAKKVRFSLEGKENTTKGKQKQQIIEAKVKVDGTDLNHTKIISEVLKKFPHLVQKNKNIKLKIMQKNSTQDTTSSTPQQTSASVQQPATSAQKVLRKVNYVVKPDQSLVKSDPETQDEVEHKSYECKECNIPNEYIQLRSYPEYHDHLLEFHPDLIDSRICEHCGHKSTRRHLLVYHQFLKHDIQPPPPFEFPSCNQCKYIALNRTLLKRHETSHLLTKCCQCKVSLKSHLDYIKHSHETGHRDPTTNFDCNYCSKKFSRTTYVIAHMRTYHGEALEKDGILNDIVLEKDQQKSGEIKIISNVAVNPGDIDNQQIDENSLEQEEVNPNAPPPTPSSEAEALVNVASGIAASLGLVVLDNNMYNNTTEYIIPEMNEDQELVVTTQNTPQAISQTDIVTTTSTVTSTDELVMVLTDHDYGDGNTPIITSENSNIVVLYSHPVEGQSSTQYISSEGNIVLDSQTGVIEMNGQKLQMANPEQLESVIESGNDADDNKSSEPEESIEMIQQEIDNHFNNAPEKTTDENEEKPSDEQVDGINNTEETQIKDVSEENLESSNQIEQEQEAQDASSEHVEESNQIDLDNRENHDGQGKAHPIEEMEIDEENVTNGGREIVDERRTTDEEQLSSEVPISEPETSKDERNSSPEVTTPDLHDSVNESAEVEAMEVDEIDLSKIKDTENESENNTILKTKDGVTVNIDNSQKEDPEKDETQVEEKQLDTTVLAVDEQVQNQSEATEIKDEENVIENKANDEEEREVVTTVDTTTTTTTTTSTTPQASEEPIEEEKTQEDQATQQSEISAKLNEEEKKDELENNEVDKEKKDNMVALVSADWCDDDSGLQESCAEDELNKSSTDNNQETATAPLVTDDKSNDNETSIKAITSDNNENKVSNIKITKLLDDWNDGDTDSQNSGETQPQPEEENKNPINNLIEDWEDDE